MTLAFGTVLACAPKAAAPPTEPAPAAPPTAEAAPPAEEAKPAADDNPLWALVEGGPEGRTEETTKAFMKQMADALGKDCNYCHSEDDPKHAEHHRDVTKWMAGNLVGLQTADGQTVGCKDCHQGKTHLFPEKGTDMSELNGAMIADLKGDEAAIKTRMKGVAEALGVKCSFCHEKKGERSRHMQIANWMAKNFVGNLRGKDGSELTCKGCHQGKAHLLPEGEEHH